MLGNELLEQRVELTREESMNKLVAIEVYSKKVLVQI